jgi:DNA polymerase-3 subunit epsilon
MRQVVLDTETTGLEPSQGHRIIEIGCVELINRRLSGRRYHQYINPEREVDAGAVEVHGITNQMLVGEPVFAQVARDFLDFVEGAELVIHNAPFDLGFLNHELRLIDLKCAPLTNSCTVVDTLVMARGKHPGQKNSLDALCKRYGVDNSQRDLHGALLDAEILADVYLLMTGGQTALSLGGNQDRSEGDAGGDIRRLPSGRAPLPVIRASDAELAAHQQKLAALDKSSGGACLWRKLEETADSAG